MNDDKPAATEAETEAKRSPGRPKGHPRSGGRPKGSKNRLPEEFRAYIDSRGRPLELLAAIARGAKVTAADPNDPTRKVRIYPSLADRTLAAKVLMDRLLPALKAVETSGTSQFKVVIGPEDEGLLYGNGPAYRREVEDLKLARQVAFLLSNGAEAQDRLEAAGLGHLIHDEDRGMLGETATESRLVSSAIEDAVEVAPIGTEVDEGDFVLRLAERLPDSRERWEARSRAGTLLGTAFDRESLSARIRDTQGH